ncbi:MAG: hypothetical protein K8T89_18060, partial [Planctomycetes bacterium]|nr:hypothetical protein [Planctomycetota bacterium]
MRRTATIPICFFLAIILTSQAPGAENVKTHPPMRSLPTATNRFMDKGPSLFVDATKGSDRQDGS